MAVRLSCVGLCVAALLAAGPGAGAAGDTAKPDADTLPAYQVEWVYRVKWGYDDEFWKIFQKTQIPVLDKEKELGYLQSYKVYRPGLHTGEDSRWNYRVIITYRNILSSSKGASLEKQLFPDQAAYKALENRRWQLIDSHYDLPIREIDPHTVED
jgi:hypothetical protein